MTVDCIEANHQMLLFTNRPRIVAVPRRADVVTWCLLVYAIFMPRDEALGTHVATCELSLPAAIDQEGFVTEWRKRIILDPVRLDDVPMRRDIDDEEDGQIDVPIRRR